MWAVHRLVSDLEPIWFATGLVLPLFTSMGGQRYFHCAEAIFIIFTYCSNCKFCLFAYVRIMGASCGCLIISQHLSDFMNIDVDPAAL